MTHAGIIVQARLTSKRFVNKMLHPINGIPLILHTLKIINELDFPIIVAIPNTTSNAGLKWLLNQHGYTVYKGWEEDVLMRFLDCAREYKIDPIIRICGDSTLIDPMEIIDTLSKYQRVGKNWLAVGLGVQVFSRKALEWANLHCSRIEEREHVWTPLQGTINYPEDVKIVEDYINGTRTS